MFYHKFEAIASWYGYDYQGVLAIYYTIKQINKLIDEQIDMSEKTSIEDIVKLIEGYSVELEYMEDFAIKYNGKYKSFHQVKSGESKIKEEDVRDLYLKLLECDDKGQQDIVGYFHVNKKDKIKDTKENLEKSIKTYFISLRNEIINLKEKEKIDYRSKKKGSAVQILADYMDDKKLDKHKKEERVNCVDELINQLDKINNKYFNKGEKYKDIFKKLFEYEKSFDSINEIEQEIYNELKLFHAKVVNQEYKVNESYLEKEKCKIGVLINIHIDRREAGDCSKEISFKEFLKILNDNLNEWGNSDEYREYKFKEKLHDYYCQYKSDREDSEKCDVCNETCYLRNELERIKGLSPDEFRKFLNNISIVKHKDCFDFPSETEIKQTLFRCMCENHKIGREEKYNIGIVKDNDDYWVIASLEDEKFPFMKKLFKEENENNNILRDADILITKHISIPDIRNYNKYFNVNRDDMKEVLKTNLDEKYNEIDNYNKARVSAIKMWTEVKGELE